jgi:hypothetical protein
MDSKHGRKKEGGKYAWLPAAMPGVARLMDEKRRLLGDAHVAECWRRGVVEGEPGWFYAREGTLHVGMPWDDLLTIRADTPIRTQVVVAMRDKEGIDHALP